MKGEPLPDGWIESKDAVLEEVLVYAKVTIDLHILSTNVEYVVKVDEELKWSLCCHSVIVENCSVLSKIPQRLTSSSELVELLNTLQSAQICQGNPVCDFRPLVDARGVEFRDATGVYACMCTDKIKTYAILAGTRVELLGIKSQNTLGMRSMCIASYTCNFFF